MATLTFNDDYDIVDFSYISDYAQSHFNNSGLCATSVRYPVAFYVDNPEAAWFYFLDDIIPSGAGRKYWVNYLGLHGLNDKEQAYQLLKHGTIAPIGNLRIKESVLGLPQDDTQIYFNELDVANRNSDFLEYAQERGSIVGGATGAGGEAPKILVRRSNNDKIWIDNFQSDISNKDQHYLVKYPRGLKNSNDCNILRTEFYYYHELASMGFDTIDTKRMQLLEGQRYPCLWLPRFDINFGSTGQVNRLGLESVYSMLKKGPGSFLDQQQTITSLVNIIQQTDMVQNKGCTFDSQAFTKEWVVRDLLNIAFGNSDNHGRNTAFLKYDNDIKLAPIYDFAPMKADDDGIVRSTKWQQPLERGGEYDFKGITQSLAHLIDPETLFNELTITAQKLIGLKQRLAARGAPEAILQHPSIGLDYLEEKLTRWGLI